MISTKTTSSSKGGVTYHKNFIAIVDKHKTVYYRATLVSCQLLYDGQEDLLSNRDKCHLFYYSFLFQYSSKTVESRNSLASYLGYYERNFAAQSP